MKATILLSLLLIISCGGPQEKKGQRASLPDPVTAPKWDHLTLLSLSPLPARIALNLDQVEVFDECQEGVGAQYIVDRFIQTIEVTDSYIYSKQPTIDFEIIDRGENCDVRERFYADSRSEIEFTKEKRDGSIQIYVKLVNPEIIFDTETHTSRSRGR